MLIATHYSNVGECYRDIKLVLLLTSHFYIEVHVPNRESELSFICVSEASIFTNIPTNFCYSIFGIVATVWNYIFLYIILLKYFLHDVLEGLYIVRIYPLSPPLSVEIKTSAYNARV